MGRAHSFSCKGSRVFLLGGNSWLISLTHLELLSQIPEKSRLVDLKVWFRLSSQGSDRTTQSLSSSREQCKWRQRDFCLGKARKSFEEEGVRPEDVGVLKLALTLREDSLPRWLVLKCSNFPPIWAFCIVSCCSVWRPILMNFLGRNFFSWSNSFYALLGGGGWGVGEEAEVSRVLE